MNSAPWMSSQYLFNNLTNLANSSQTWADDTTLYESWLLGIISPACVLLAIFGCLGNIVTIRTFFRMGIFEAVNLTLAWLAASDLCFLVSDIGQGAAMLFNFIEIKTDYRLWFPVDPKAVHSALGNIGSASYANTMLVTTFITAARCLIVAKPLRFRDFLSWKTTLIIMFIFSCLSLTSMILLLAYLGVIPQFDSRIDTVRPMIWYSPERKIAKVIVFSLRDAFLPFASQISVSACVFIMARSLREALNFRRIYTTTHVEVKATHVNSSATAAKVMPNFNPDTKSTTRNRFAETDNFKTEIVGKELKLVRQMLIIASVYSVCNMPKVIANLLELSVPGFFTGQRYQAWYNISQTLREFFQNVNATVNFWIHWRFNSKFRKHCIFIHVK